MTLLLWGYTEGSRILRPLALQLKTGLKEWPELYMMMAHMLVGTYFGVQLIYTNEKYKLDWTARYKQYYTIYRKGDPRIQLYPRHWVTDTQYLDDDHPMTTQEVAHFLLKPVEVHRFDPKIRGNWKSEYPETSMPNSGRPYDFPLVITNDPLAYAIKKREEEEKREQEEAAKKQQQG